MLIEFRVRNFRSILDEQCFSMIAGKGDEHLESNTFDPEIPGVPRLVRAALLCGANASGKSNLVKAMSFVGSFVSDSAAESKPGEKIPVEPHLLDVDATHEPTAFDLFFAVEGVRYQYGFELDSHRVLGEWLFAAPEGRSQCWFERDSRTHDKTDWYFGPNLKGRKRVIQESTRENALFLSTGAQLNNPQLLKVWGWFDQVFRPLSHPNQLNNLFSTYMCESESGRDHIIEMMKNADLGIDGITVKKTDWKSIRFPDGLPEEAQREFLAGLPKHRVEPVFLHKRTGDQELIPFAFEDESAGTQAVFELAGPLLDVLNNGFVMVMDELDSSLHPFLAERLVRYFLNNQSNKSSAQLIFTAHNPYLLKSDFLRRDQVWFVAKPRTSTILLPHTEFHPRKDEDRMRNYLGGRYGALPFVSSAFEN